MKDNAYKNYNTAKKKIEEETVSAVNAAIESYNISKNYIIKKEGMVREHRMVRGSYTVEAALIFPTVLFIIIGLIYFGFYQHDQDKLEAVINETLLKGRNLIQNEADIKTGAIDYKTYNNRSIFYSLQDNLQGKKQEIYNYAWSRLNKGLFAATVNSIDVQVSHTDLSVEIKGEMAIPFVGLGPLFSGSGTLVTGINSAAVQNNPEFIRVFDIFSGAADKVPVIHETLTKLQQLLNKLK